MIDLCKIYVKFILAKFMASSSNFGNNLAEEIHKIKCKYGNDDEKMWALWIKYKECEFTSWIQKHYRWFNRIQMFIQMNTTF